MRMPTDICAGNKHPAAKSKNSTFCFIYHSNSITLQLELQTSGIMLIYGLQRICAVLLLVLLSFSLIAPALSAGSPSKLPACCRKDGKHRCAMANMADPESQGSSPASDKIVSGKCAQFPGANSLPTSFESGTAYAAQATFAAIVSHPTAHAQTEARYRISFSRSSQKRGPPSPA